MKKTGFCLVILCFQFLEVHGQFWSQTFDFSSPAEAIAVFEKDNGNSITIINAPDGIYGLELSEEGEIEQRTRLSEGKAEDALMRNDKIYIAGYEGIGFSQSALLLILDMDLEILSSDESVGGYYGMVQSVGDVIFLGGSDLEDNALLVTFRDDQITSENSFILNGRSEISGVIELEDELILVCGLDDSINRNFNGMALLSVDKETDDVEWSREFNHSLIRDFQLLQLLEYVQMSVIHRDGDDTFKVILNANAEDVIQTFDINGTLISSYPLTLVNGMNPHFALEAEGNILLGGYTEYGAEIKAAVELRNEKGGLIWRRELGPGVFLGAVNAHSSFYCVGINSFFLSGEALDPLISKIGHDGQIHNSILNLEAFIVNECDNINADVFSDLTIYANDLLWIPDEDGKFKIDLPVGEYDLNVRVPNGFEICDNSMLSIGIEDGETINGQIYIKEAACKHIAAGIAVNDLIRCKRSYAIGEIRNDGTETLSDITAHLRMSDEFQNLVSNHDFDVQNGEYIFSFDQLEPDELQTVWLSFDVPCSFALHQSECFEFEVFPKVHCNKNIINWTGPQLQIDASCVEEEVQINLTNVGQPMMAESTYSLYANAQKFESNPFLLSQNEELSISVRSPGQTISMVANQVEDFPGDKIVTESIEACGTQINGNFSKGFLQMFGHRSSDFLHSTQCLLVRDYAKRDGISNIPKGLGDFKVINNDLVDVPESVLSFSLEGFDLSEPIEIDLAISSGILAQTFTPLVSSHEISFQIINKGLVKIQMGDAHIEDIDKFFLRYSLEIDDGASSSALRFVQPIVCSSTHSVQLQAGFYNFIEDLDTEEFPFANDDFSFLFGTGGGINFHGGLIDLNYKLHNWQTYLTNDDSPKSILSILDEKNVLIKQKEFQEEDRISIEKLLKVKEDEYWLLGSLNDPELYSFANSDYYFIASFNHNGNLNWTKKWKGTDCQKTSLQWFGPR